MPDDEVAGAGRPVWSGTISFGLVSIPVTLLPASREGRVALRMLAEDGTPLRRRYFCPREEREVHSEHLLRGYEVAPEQYVIVRDEELEGLAPEKSRDIDLRRFVNVAEIDPIYFERAYFLLPDKASNKAYRLLAETMEKNGKAGIATFIMHERERLVAILAQDGLLRAELMRFKDEVRTPEEVGLPERSEAPKQVVGRIERTIKAASADSFDARDFIDEYKRRLLKLVARKAESNRDVVETAESGEAEGPSVRNLMDALQESLSKARQSSKAEARERKHHPAGKRGTRSAEKRHRPDAGEHDKRGAGRRRRPGSHRRRK